MRSKVKKFFKRGGGGLDGGVWWVDIIGGQSLGQAFLGFGNFSLYRFLKFLRSEIILQIIEISY